jgi:type II secretion system protein H
MRRAPNMPRKVEEASRLFAGNGTAAGRRCHFAASRGFTLVELMVVVAIVGIMSVAIIAEMHGTLQDALLRSTSRELAGAFNLASSRAIAVNRPHRICFDRAAHRWFLERGRRGRRDFYPALDAPDCYGPLDSRISLRVLEPGVNAPDDAGVEPSGNPVRRDDFSSNREEEAVTFYPDGTADARQIVLTDGDGFGLALRVSPVTSRVQISTLPHL